jgi:hypothetical protein
LAVPGKVTLLQNRQAKDFSRKAFLRHRALEQYMQGGFLCEHLENIIGTVWGGHAAALLDFYMLYNETLRAVTARGIADDDQPLLEMCLAQRGSLFQTMYGDFFSMFELC